MTVGFRSDGITCVDHAFEIDYRQTIGSVRSGWLRYLLLLGRQFMGWAVYAPSEYPLRGSRASARQRAVLRTFHKAIVVFPIRFWVAMRGSSGSAGVSWGVMGCL